MFLLPPLMRLAKQPGVSDVCFDMCQYGLCDPVSGSPYRRAVRLLGRLPGLDDMAVICDGSHQHQHVEDSIKVNGKSVKRSKVAGVYPGAFCFKLATLFRTTVNQSVQRCEIRRRKNLRA